MLTLTTINTIKLVIALVASYFPTVALSGCFAAWMAKKLGDNGPERDGLLTLNPIEHTRVMGLVILLMAVVARFPFIFGFGRLVQINEHNISGPLKKLKYLLALWARPFANVFLMCFSMFVWVAFVKLAVKPYALDKTYPALLDSAQLLYLIFRQLNMISAMLELIFGLVRYIMSFVFPNAKEESFFVILVVEIYLLLMLWYFVAPYLNVMVMFIEGFFSYCISGLIG